MGINKNASSNMSLDIEKLTDPLLPMMPKKDVEPTVDTEYHDNVDILTDSKTQNKTDLMRQSDSDDRPANTEEDAANESEKEKTSTQEEHSSIDDNLSSEHSEIPINVPS